MDYTLNLNGRLFSLNKPAVMGILNVTPDSFYADSRQQSEQQIASRAHQIVDEGASIIDIGACSTRPDSTAVSEKEEMERLRTALTIVRRELSPYIEQQTTNHPNTIAISVDTFRPDVARMAVEEFGVHIINDVSEGSETMFRMTARLNIPYILTSVQANLHDTFMTFAKKVQQLRDFGQKDIILDPGFGFGKTLDDNFSLFNEIEKLHVLNLPLLVGISRKSMIYKTLGCMPDKAFCGTIALNTVALQKGVSILRVHDVKEAVECCKLITRLQSPIAKS